MSDAQQPDPPRAEGAKLIQIATTAAGASAGMGRRQMLQSLLAGAGAGIALPIVADAHPMQHHLADHARVAVADQKAQKAATAAYKPAFLDEHQLKTLAAIAERIVPGSTKAQVAPFIDQLLAVDAIANQRSFLGAMGAFEMQAIEKFGKPWRSLTAAQQDELLTIASTADSGLKTVTPAASGRPAVSEGAATVRDHFDNLRGWIAGAYYSSEIGMRELGWTGEMFFEKLPECTHEGGHG